MSETSYDVVPYANDAHPQTHIAHLFTIGRLFNLTPPDFRKARVLDLGCASGSNIIPMAAEYADAQFVGIDLSDAQIRRGQDLIGRAGLKNIVLKAQSIADFGTSGEPFDYIICHGVFSWIPPDIRTSLLKIVRQNLSPNGLAVVSYNAMPGWGAVRSLRDIMLYHTAGFPTPAEKVAQARALLQFILDSQGDFNSPYRAFLEQEVNLLKAANPNYFFHEYLEEHNQPFYLHEVVAMAAREDLAYLGDTDMPSMFLGNYTPHVGKLLAGTNDPVRIEQYLDFVTNRRFRSSVLMVAGASINRSMAAARIEEFWLQSLLQPETPVADGELAPDAVVRFNAETGLTYTASGAPIVALLSALCRHGRPATVTEIVAEARERYRLPQSEAELRRSLCETALHLFLARGLELRSDPARYVDTLSERPVVLPLARAQAVDSDRVTNAFHRSVIFDPLGRFILRAVDGSRDRAALTAYLMTAVASGQLKLEHEGNAVTDAAAIERNAAAAVDHFLSAFRANALLSA
ncbi:MAG TPA: class I SAM-dependent methyltransferase [Stellaceae bacterium]|jgi:methyltransferase-like protein/SAM-dependent methyltransferase|nr:class I SAM-dependent methyltransferase [Stellaceae bacterium]